MGKRGKRATPLEVNRPPPLLPAVVAAAATGKYPRRSQPSSPAAAGCVRGQARAWQARQGEATLSAAGTNTGTRSGDGLWQRSYGGARVWDDCFLCSAVHLKPLPRGGPHWARGWAAAALVVV